MKPALLHVLSVVFILFAFPAFAQDAPPLDKTQKESAECIALLHGMGRVKSSMETMENEMTSHGYDVFNIDYESRQKGIEDLIVDLQTALNREHAHNCSKLHFAGHSMGGLVIRAYIHKYRPKNLGRVVLLGTPNQGSEVADLLADTPPYKAFYGPAGQELVTDQEKFKNLYGTLDYDLGVIAGDRSIDPVSSWMIIPGKDDGKVAIKRTKLTGMKDHIVIHATHTFLPRNETVIRQTEHFIKYGAFDHSP